MRALTITDLGTIKNLTPLAEKLFAHHKFKEMQNVKVEDVPGRQFIFSRLIEWQYGMPVISYLVKDMDRPDDKPIAYYECRLESL